MRDAPRGVQEMFAKVWADMERETRRSEAERAKANPTKYRESRVIEGGLDYKYYDAKNGRGSKVRFCYSVNRNVAGFFLVWREIVTKQAVKRDQWDSAKTKDDAVLVCRKRWEAFIEPPTKRHPLVEDFARALANAKPAT